MLGRHHIFAAAALCVSSYAMAASPSIGTVTARGFTYIDKNRVEGSGTLFDGSVVETGNSAMSGADLRLANNTVLTLNTNSGGTLHTDHFLLKRGSIKVTSSNTFNVQADNLVVVPAGDSSGVVTIDDDNSVGVEAQKGTLEVRNAAGARIAQVHPGSPLSFTSTGKSSSGSTATKAVPSAKNHNDLPTVDANMIPAGLMLSGVSAQTSSQLGGWSVSPRAADTGGDGGNCSPSQMKPCCTNIQGQSPFRGLKCCPGYFPTKQQCNPSN